MCGIGDNIVTIFGKCNLPQWQDQKPNLDSTNCKPKAHNCEVILLHMYRKTVPSLLGTTWKKEILVFLHHELIAHSFIHLISLGTYNKPRHYLSAPNNE